MGPLKLSTLISDEKIQKRVVEIGAELSDKFGNQENVVMICVLNGSFVFYSDLVRQIETDVVCEFIGLSSYGNSHKSCGEVKLTLDVTNSLEGKHVVIVEDIIDTGLTMQFLQHQLNGRNPKSVTTVTLLHKPSAKKVDCEIDIVGFEIPNDFVVGYGLDYMGMYRNLPYLAQVQNMN